jgi:RHH-type transcriptional regulator, rel operon repressor / antitoxin RelB
MNTLCIRIPDKINKRLNHLASQTGRTKTYYIREAIVGHIEELEDIYIALKRLETPEKNYSLEEME